MSDEVITHMPIDPGYYAHVPDMGWVRFDHLADMLFFRLQYDPPLELCRIVHDIGEATI